VPSCRWLIPREAGGRWWARTIALIAAVLALKLAYLAWVCPYTLVEDEAHYWTWSQRLDWSYYSKGPGIAWTIALANALCTPIGLRDTELAVRMTAAFLAAIFTLVLADLARRVAGDGRAAWVAALMCVVMPVYYATGVLMTIDMPFLAMWALGAWGLWRATHESWRPGWPVLGLAIALGTIYKYTMLLIVPGLVLAWLFARRSGADATPSSAMHDSKRISLTPWLLAALGLALLGLAPILVWNAQRDWPTIAHLLGHLGLAGGDVPRDPAAKGWWYKPEWTLTLIVTQLALVGPAIGILAAASLEAWRSRSSERRQLLALALPVLGVYFFVSFLTEPEGNWPIAAYVTLIPLTAQRLIARVDAGRVPVMWKAAIVLMAILIPISLRGDLLRLVPVVGQAWRWQGREQRPLVPLGRLSSADVMAADVARLAEKLARETSAEPMIIAQQYGRASLLEFYLTARGTPYPPVLCASSLTGGRRTQYDLWPDKDLRDLARWQGRPALIVGGELWHWQPAFERIVELGPIKGETKASRKAYFGYGYRGWPVSAAVSPSANDDFSGAGR
jgi:4-amino-4-deoxy-L-arabinose transferase-like glycosyltransferase